MNTEPVSVKLGASVAAPSLSTTRRPTESQSSNLSVTELDDEPTVDKTLSRDASGVSAATRRSNQDEDEVEEVVDEEYLDEDEEDDEDFNDDDYKAATRNDPKERREDDEEPDEYNDDFDEDADREESGFGVEPSFDEDDMSVGGGGEEDEDDGFNDPKPKSTFFTSSTLSRTKSGALQKLPQRGVSTSKTVYKDEIDVLDLEEEEAADKERLAAVEARLQQLEREDTDGLIRKLRPKEDASVSVASEENINDMDFSVGEVEEDEGLSAGGDDDYDLNDKRKKDKSGDQIDFSVSDHEGSFPSDAYDYVVAANPPRK